MSSTSSPVSAGLAGQLIAGAGAVLVLLGSFGSGFEYAGVAVLVLGVVVAAPDARVQGPYLAEWWTALGAGSLACLIGVALGLLLPVAGAIVVSVGAVVALVAVGLGVPVTARRAPGA